MDLIKIKLQRLEHSGDLPLPNYSTSDSSGMDLCAAISEEVIINPSDCKLIPTGFSIAIPRGFEGQIRPRSGLAIKHGLTVLNTPGTIDADYRGELKVVLINLGASSFIVSRGMRIAQLVIAPVTRISWQEVDGPLEQTARTGGFGSTGLHVAQK